MKFVTIHLTGSGDIDITLLFLLAMEFSYDELKKATNSFTKMIGEGAFGKVYLGSNIRNSGTPAAIKVLNEVRCTYDVSLVSQSICTQHILWNIRWERKLSRIRWQDCPLQHS